MATLSSNKKMRTNNLLKSQKYKILMNVTLYNERIPSKKKPKISWNYLRQKKLSFSAYVKAIKKFRERMNLLEIFHRT
jgi:hypothetical protein